MRMKEILGKLSKETRCYIMSALLFFEGFDQIDDFSEYRVKMSLDVLGLSRIDMECFQMPDYSQIVTQLKGISDSEVQDWIITNTYSPVLRSRRIDALKAFGVFCFDLKWDINEIKETMKVTEDLCELKPIDNVEKYMRVGVNSGSGCLTGVILFFGFIVFALALIS